MAEEPALTLRLSQEEVVLLAGMLNASFVAGLGDKPLGDLPSEQINAALAAAEAGLRARDLVRIAEDGTRQVDEVATALLGTCAFPAYSLVLTVNPPSGLAEQHFFHHLEGLTVQHSVAEAGIHRFDAVLSADDLDRRLAAPLDISAPHISRSEQITLPEDVLVRAREAAERGGAPAALDALVRGGVSLDCAGELAAALAVPRTSAAVVRLDHRSELEEPVEGFALLEGKDSLWRIGKTRPEDGGPLNVQAVATTDVTAELQRLAQPLGQIGPRDA